MRRHHGLPPMPESHSRGMPEYFRILPWKQRRIRDHVVLAEQAYVQDLSAKGHARAGPCNGVQPDFSCVEGHHGYLRGTGEWEGAGCHLRPHALWVRGRPEGSVHGEK